MEIYIDEPSANLSFTPTSGCPPLCVEFTTDEPFNVAWEIGFGNGDTLSADATPCGPGDAISDCITWNAMFTHDQIDSAYRVPFAGGFNFPACVKYDTAGSYDIMAIATNINGCIDTTIYDDAVVVNTDPDFASFTHTITSACGPLCIDFVADNVLGTYQWSYRTSFLSPWTSFGGNSPTPSLCVALPVSSLEVRLQGDMGTCSDTQVVPIPMPSLAASAFSIIDATPCVGQLVNFEETTLLPASNYAWLVEADPVPGTIAMGHAFTSSGLYDVCLVVTDATYGCQDTLCQIVEAYTPDPQFELSLSPVGCNTLFTACDTATQLGSTYTYELLSIYPPAAPETLWVNTANPCVNQMLALGVYDLVVSVSGPAGWNDCTVNDTIHDLLGLGDVLGPFTWTGDTVRCKDFCTTFQVFNPLAIGYAYLWDFGDGSGATGTIVSHCYSDTGTFCPRLQVVFPNGCDPHFESDSCIVVLPYDVTVAYDDNICFGDSSFAEFTPGNFAIGNITFTPASDVTALPPWYYALSPPITRTYIATSTYAQCEDKDTLHIEVLPLPALIAQPFGPFCKNDGQLPDPVVLPFGPPGISTWSQVLPLNTGSLLGVSHAITYTYTDTLGCTNSIDISFTVNDTTAVAFDSMHVCIDALPVDLNDFVSLPGDTFMTKYGNVWVTLPSLFSPAAVVPPPTTVVTVPIEYHYTNAFGCTSINDSVMTVHPLPLLSFTVHDTCAHTPLVIVNTSTINSGTVQNWLWNITGQQPLTSQQVGPFSYGADTIGIQLTATSDRGCSTTLADTALVHPVPAAGFLVEDDCQFDTIPYTNLSTIDWAEPLYWDWRFEDGTNSTVQNPSHAWPIWGSFIDTLIVSSSFGCADTTTRAITVHPAPIPGIAFTDTCFAIPSVINSTSTIPQGTIDQHTWDLGEGALQVGTTALHQYSAPGHWPIELTVVSDQGCTATALDTIEIFPLPQVGWLVSDTAICVHECVQFTDVSTVTGPYQNVDWQWTVSNGHGPRTGHHRVFPGKW
ncbi:MAG: hypothetical protein IPG69_04880 [Flavobacteriales bacterium]|nr:hypothetical protein [Flavobacteriales bacterium]